MYFAKPIENLQKTSGWRTLRVGVFQSDGEKELQIGSYERNYGSLFDTFFPFSQNGKDLALYSSDYTATRIMELPSCLDIGGEEPNDSGFCPVDYFIPTYMEQEMIHKSNNTAFPPERISKTRINNPTGQVLKEFTTTHKYTNLNTGQECEDIFIYKPLTPVAYYDFGFVSGCIWADESTWKIQYLDLSEASKGVLKRDDRFGYVELPDEVRLKDAVDMYEYGNSQYDEVAHLIRIKTLQTFDLTTGKPVNQ